MIEEESIGVKNAALRRLNFELGIPLDQIQTDDFTYLTRILYASPSGGPWGEHELDYILFLRGNYDLNVNVNEVKNIEYVKRENFNAFLKSLAERNIPITPWFKLIVETFLPQWWKDLDRIEEYKDHLTIHDML